MENKSHSILFTVKTKSGKLEYQTWTTEKEAEKKRPIYEKAGYIVTTKDISKENGQEKEKKCGLCGNLFKDCYLACTQTYNINE
jgi:hypothetical protein